MSYLVLARKHRPQSFDDVVGQEHITDLLKKACSSNKVAHAYLFSGPRGIGKTSCARILSKSLNCEKGPTLTPCDKCPACLEITKGTSFDVLEIDGASNRGIDEIRSLRENVKFAPASGKYKIYIIDEVHMLTTEAFNALLKTLEEPPEHVKFIFATTEPNKVPPTIVSRCQKFDFKRVQITTIQKLLADIAKKENYQIDEEALFAIAKAAKGSLRDSLSILDQLSALSERNIAAEDVFSMLGLVELELVFDLVDALSEKDCMKALETLERIVEKGKDVKQLVKDLIEHYRNLMVIKVGGKSLGKLVDYPANIKDMLLTQTDRFALNQILMSIDILVQVNEVARVTESIRLPLEVAFAKLTYNKGNPNNSAKVNAVAAQSKPQPAQQPTTSVKHSIIANNKGQVAISSHEESDKVEEDVREELVPEYEEEPEEVSVTSQEEDVQEDVVQAAPAPADGSLNLTFILEQWDHLTHHVSKERMSIATYLQEGKPAGYEGSMLTIEFPEKFKFNKSCLEDEKNQRFVEDKFSEVLNHKITIQYTLVKDYVPKNEDSSIQSALNTFGGEVINRWHNDGE